MPRESERSSSTVSRAWSERLVDGRARRARGPRLELPLGPAEVHAAAGPGAAAGRRGCRARAGAATRPPPPGRRRGCPDTRATSVCSSARLAQQHRGEAGVDRGGEPHHQRQGDQRDGPDREVGHALRRTPVAEPEQVGESVVPSALVGDAPLPEPVGQARQRGRPPDQRHREGEGRGDQADDRPHHVEPRLRVPERGQQPCARSRVRRARRRTPGSAPAGRASRAAAAARSARSRARPSRRRQISSTPPMKHRERRHRARGR